MTNQDLVLNIAVNLSRIGRFLLEKRTSRVQQFTAETKAQLAELSNYQLSKPLNFPVSQLQKLINQPTPGLAEEYFTLAAILTHRAKLA